MIDIDYALKAFEAYMDHFDLTIPQIKMKYRHTYGVVEACRDLCERMQWNETDTHLALLISLLHDYGRFEQWMTYQTYRDDLSVDHGKLGVELLFEKGHIRHFVEDEKYDEIIKTAILYHNRYDVKDVNDPYVLNMCHLIRDVDKLDHFRVKREESIETFFGISLEELEKETITPIVAKEFCSCQLIHKEHRQTHLDMWLSYSAFIFDFHYKACLDIIRDHDEINYAFDKVTPADPKTRETYEALRALALRYVNHENENFSSTVAVLCDCHRS